MITLKFPLKRKPTPEEWRKVWDITGIPPNAGVRLPATFVGHMLATGATL